MGNTDNKVVLYTSQAPVVAETLMRDAVCFSKREYVVKKYGESAKVFTAAYDWFVAEAQRLVPRPEGAQYPYWAFSDLHSVEHSGDSVLLKLCVPVDEIVFFDMYDWNKIMRMQLLGLSEREEADYRAHLAACGIHQPSDAVLTNFYPAQKREVQDSWQRLFRHHSSIAAGEPSGVGSVQAALWQLKREWVV